MILTITNNKGEFKVLIKGKYFELKDKCITFKNKRKEVKINKKNKKNKKFEIVGNCLPKTKKGIK